VECEADLVNSGFGVKPDPRTEHCGIGLGGSGTVGVKYERGQAVLTVWYPYFPDVFHKLAWRRQGDAQAFADALNFLSAVARGEDNGGREAEWRDFQQKAAAWRALPTKPAISEEVRKHRVLAENAVKEKQFDTAIEQYEAGLEIDPVWPEGHFNSALLAAELGYYSEAIRHMRAYVELVPDAADAQQARDQMVIWEDKLKKPGN
jgi:tetratricopeptide (TPR) repeat protein